MKYKIESIGGAFSDRAIDNLASQFNARSNDGWELHSVFSVQKTGCLGNSVGSTYLAIYRRPD